MNAVGFLDAIGAIYHAGVMSYHLSREGRVLAQ